MRALLNLRRYPTVIIFGLAGAFAITLAFSSFNLFQMSLDNLSYLRHNDWFGMMQNNVVQLLINAGWGAFCLLCFLGFKACEIELMQRYRDWTGRRD